MVTPASELDMYKFWKKIITYTITATIAVVLIFSFLPSLLMKHTKNLLPFSASIDMKLSDGATTEVDVSEVVYGKSDLTVEDQHKVLRTFIDGTTANTLQKNFDIVDNVKPVQVAEFYYRAILKLSEFEKGNKPLDCELFTYKIAVMFSSKLIQIIESNLESNIALRSKDVWNDLYKKHEPLLKEIYQCEWYQKEIKNECNNNCQN